MVYVDIYVCDISFPFALKISQMDVLHEVETGGQYRHLVNAFFFFSHENLYPSQAYS